MRVSTIKYTIQQGLRNITKNKMFSFASIATMVACIFLFGVFYALIANVQGTMKNIEESLPILVYFEKDTKQKQIDKIGKELEKHEDISEVKYVSAEEAWENFKPVYFGEDAEAMTGFEEDNPLADSDHYEVYMKSVDKQDTLVKYASGLKGVRKVDASAKAAEALKNISVLLATISGIITGILLIVAIFLISNTVSMGITVRREEIAIMKYIGAKDSFVRAPFILEGVIIGLAGAAIPLIVLYIGYQQAIKYFSKNVQMLANFIEFMPASKVFFTLVPVSLALGVGIGFIGSFFTIKKHLKA